MRSMTGFALQKTTFTINNLSIYATISLKSVNAKFFEVLCKFPYALHHLEIECTKLLKQELIRGHLFLSITVNDQSAFKGSISAALPIAQEYIAAIKHIQEKTGVTGELTVGDIIDLPNIFSTTERLLDENDTVKEQLMNAVHKTIKLLILEQTKEADLLLKDLIERIRIVTKCINDIAVTHEAFMEQRKTEILRELQQYSSEDTLIETRKAALSYALDKIDIHEEIVRFKSHLQNLNLLLTSHTDEVGKRLDFTLQELGREINTIAAKCSNATIGSYAIDIKVELEKAREQIQNIV